jgi:uncharacterized circularly permuted ATP-grasp superfamily protein/uncharacterized alpha-E superfamily protein
LASSYDEMVTGTGSLRPHWRGLMEALGGLTARQLAEKRDRIAAQMADDDELLGLPGRTAASAPSRSLDPLPLILPEAEWAELAAGLEQRAKLLDLILSDLYGPQHLIEEQLLPPYLVLGNPAFLRPMRRVQPARGLPQLYFYAADLVRLANGTWRVYADRTEASAGVAYALHTRHVLARAFPELFRGAQVRRLQSFVELWRSSLRAIADDADGAPSIVLLTPGPYNDAYFEHVFLARALGITLVQGSDLTMRGDHVYLKTLDGLVKVDVIYRRVDGDYCDSLELREDSALGTAGLVQAARAGNVAIVNMPGTATVQTPALAPFLPELARRLLGSELQLPAVTTWWCGQAHALAEVRAGLDRFALHSVFDPTPEPIEPALLSADERARFEAELERHPERFVARETMSPSMAPCLADGDKRAEYELVPRPVVLRAMSVWNDGRWIALPGGVARVVRGNSIYRNAWSHGGIAKDVWVLSDHDNDLAVAAIPSPAVAVGAARQETAPRSRTVDDLYWLGRYVERLDAGARQFVATLQRFVRGGLSARDLAELGRLAEALKRTGWITYTVASAPVDGTMFLDGVTSAAAEGTALRVSIDALRRLTRDARDQLSPSMWLALQRITAAGSAQFGRGTRAPDTLLLSLDATIVAVAGFSGYAAENMARSTGWRFLDLGRRIERAMTIAQLVPALAAGPASQLDAGLRLALELCDSTSPFVFGQPAEAQYAQALAFVLAERTNPRSLLYQLCRIERLLATQAASGAVSANVAIVPALIRSIESAMPATTDNAASRFVAPLDLLDRTVAGLLELSDSITRVYFTHLTPELVPGSLRRPVPVAAAP